MSEVFVYDAVRIPFGRYAGALANCRPDDLAAHVVRTLVGRAPRLDPARVDEVVLGNANGAGEDNRNVARMAGLLAGLPTSVPATTITGCAVRPRCGDHRFAPDRVGRGERRGRGRRGVDEPGAMGAGTEKPFPAGDATLVSTTLGWRLVNPAMPAAWTVSLGEATEQLREREGVTREEQDEFALRSHQTAAAAWMPAFTIIRSCRSRKPIWPGTSRSARTRPCSG